jgi:DNA processing protein
MHNNLHAIMALQHLPGLGSAHYWQLLDQFENAAKVIAHPAHDLHLFLNEEARQLLTEYQQRGESSKLGQKIVQNLDWLAQQSDVQLLPIDHPSYPELLRQITRPPALLYVRGDSSCLSLPQIAIVGSRNPTSGGHDNAYQFARHLAGCGFAITSGLALGVDGAAHAGALAAQGKTIAVFGTGIDSVYPARHRPLAQQILAEGGALISEFPLGTRSQASNFPQRNRLISGLSCGTLVVEAAVQSGSLITARLALQQNREVFAIPGSIHNPLARGCHSLIRQGATLVETGEDIVEQLGGMLALKREELQETQTRKTKIREPKTKKVKPTNESTISTTQSTNQLTAQALDTDEQTLLAAIGFDPTPFDRVVERSGMAVNKVAAQLMGLELKGAVESTALGYIRIN